MPSKQVPRAARGSQPRAKRSPWLAWLLLLFTLGFSLVVYRFSNGAISRETIAWNFSQHFSHDGTLHGGIRSAVGKAVNYRGDAARRPISALHVVANVSGDVTVLSTELARVCSTPLTDTAVLRMPWRIWTHVRITAGESAAKISCASSTWPLREAVLPFLESAHLSSSSGAAAPTTPRNFFVSRAPFEWDDTFDVLVDARAACALAGVLPSFGGATAARATPVQLTAGGVWAAVCGRSASVDGDVIGDDVGMHESINAVPLGVIRNCARGSAPAGGAGDSAAQRFAVSGLLLDGVLPGDAVFPGTSRIGCGVVLAYADALDSIRTNYVAAHAARDLSNVVEPARLAAAIVRPVPNRFMDDSVIPLMHTSASDVSDAVVSGDGTRIRAALMPSPNGGDVPSLLTSFNVMVGPTGVLQSLVSAPPRNGTGPRTATSPISCPDYLESIFEAEPEALAESKRLGRPAFEASAVGGDAALADLRDRSPTVRFVPAWPENGGGKLSEFHIKASRTLITHGAGVIPGGHLPCADSEVGDLPEVPFISEVLVLPAALSYDAEEDLGNAIAAIGVLQMMSVYLRAHPHVRLHVTPYGPGYALGDAADTLAWVELMGFSDRVVHGRMIASVAHVPDVMPRGPRVHPLHVLAARDAAQGVLAHAATPASNAAITDRPAALMVQRQTNMRRVMTIGQLQSSLVSGRGVTVKHYSMGRRPNGSPSRPYNSSEASGALLAALTTWVGSTVVIAPHGSELSLAALVLAPNATVIEAVPAGYAAFALGNMIASHYVRLHHTIVTTAGAASLVVEFDFRVVTALACAALGPLGCPLPPPPANATVLDDFPLKRQLTQRSECLPSPRPPPLPPLTAAEPFRALVKWPGFNATPRDGCYVGRPRTRDAQFPWISLPHVLPLSAATGGIALLLPAGELGQNFFATDPVQRPLIRALEREHILPVALPSAMCAPARNDVTPHNYSSACGNDDIAMVAGAAVAIVAAVRDAIGMTGSQHLPIYTMGLSSGAVFPGALGVHLHIDAIVGQMEPPQHSLLERIQADGVTLAPAPHCSAPSLQSRPEYLAPKRVPSLWMTASAIEPVEGPAVHVFATEWTKKTGEAPVVNTWVPTPLWHKMPHERAPWLLSAAAGRLVVETFFAFGIVVPATASEWADLASYIPVCNDDAGRGVTPLPSLPLSHGGAARDMPLLSMRGIPYRNEPHIVTSVLLSLRQALAFPREVDRASGGLPTFVTASDAAKLLKPPMWFSRNNSGACAMTSSGGFVGWTGPDSEDCRRALMHWDLLREYIRRLVHEVRGWHEYHEAPWADMAAWLARRGSAAVA